MTCSEKSRRAVPVLFLMLAMILSGCGRGAGRIEIPLETPDNFKNTQKVTARYSTKQDMFYDPAEGTQLILHFKCDLPEIYIENDPVSTDAINQAIASLNSQYFSNSQGQHNTKEDFMLTMAEDNFAVNYGKQVIPYSFERRAEIRCPDSSTVELTYTDITDTYEHTEEKRVYCFDKKSGMLITDHASDNARGSAGALHINRFDGSMSGYKIEDLVTACEDGTDILIITDGIINDMELSYNASDGSIQKLWYCSELENAAVQVRIGNEVNDETLLMSFNSADGGRNTYLVNIGAGNGAITVADHTYTESLG